MAPRNGHTTFSTYFWIFLNFNSPVHNLLFDLCTGIIFTQKVSQLWCKIRARFVFIVLLFFSKNSIFHFNSSKEFTNIKKIFIYTLTNRVPIEKNNTDIYQHIYHIFLNLIISKSATKYHNSSSMANGIGRSHNPGKQNRKRPDSNTDTSKSASTHSNSHANLNENIDITS